jgi:hypothetical protein
MKNLTKIVVLLLLVVATASAQQEKGIIGSSNWLDNWTEFKPFIADYDDANQILAGNITVNTKLLKKNIYVLQGNVYLTNNAVLTIEPGTVIKGDFESKGTLIVTKGAQIVADGLETDPIVFTSNRSTRKAGDWGGIVVLGDAPINKFGSYAAVNLDLDPSLTIYGGANAASSSGVLRYVRIEYAGKRIKGTGENFNSLLLAGVGNKTIVENVMVSYSAGDSFEFFGGDIVLNKLVSYRSNGVDFKFTLGTQARIDNSLAVRSSYIISNAGSRCFDVSSFINREEVDFTKKQTVVFATNLTLMNDSENIKADIQSGLVKEAVLIGENSSVFFKRSVISGFNTAVILDDKITIDDDNLKKIKFEEMYFNFCKKNICLADSYNNEDLESWYGNSVFFNVYAQSDNSETFIDFLNSRRPDYRLQLSKITASK